jgi:DNA-binding Lrp family transcriptional regulator
MVDEKSFRNQAYVLLNVDYKHQKDIINKAKSLSTVSNVKVMYGIYDIMVILESNDMGAIKKTIDVDLHELDGITNMTSLVTVGIAGAILE